MNLLLRILCPFVLATFVAIPALAQTPAAAATTAAPAEQRTELEADWVEMKSTDKETTVLCVGNVVLTATNMRLACDRLEIIATRIGEEDVAIATLDQFKYLLATGNVRINQDDREVTCERAEVLPLEEKITLTGNPVLIDRSTDTITTGEWIIMRRGQRQVEGKNIRMSGPTIKDLGAEAKDAPPAQANQP